MARGNRVALALGSGGARGYAHIGVIEELQERGFEIVGVAGTSMGALVGGLHAAGRLEAYTEWVRTLSQRDVLRLLDPSIKALGAIRADKILAKVSELLDGVLIEELPMPFTAVATDLLARKEVWFQTGPVDAAIRASIAIPGVITPVRTDGRLLADGGLLNPIPIAATAAVHADLTVAVSLSGEDAGAPVQAPGPAGSEEWLDRVWRGATQVIGALGTMVSDDAADATDLGTLDVMRASLDVVQGVVTRYRLAGYPPDLLITVPKTAAWTLDFHRAAELIALGRELTAQALDGAGLTAPQTESAPEVESETETEPADPEPEPEPEPDATRSPRGE